MVYQISHTTATGGNAGGATSGYFFSLIGTKGETNAHDCAADRNEGVTSSCPFEDTALIGELEDVKLINTKTDMWSFVSMEVKVAGVLQGSWTGFKSLQGSPGSGSMVILSLTVNELLILIGKTFPFFKHDINNLIND